MHVLANLTKIITHAAAVQMYIHSSWISRWNIFLWYYTGICTYKVKRIWTPHGWTKLQVKKKKKKRMKKQTMTITRTMTRI